MKKIYLFFLIVFVILIVGCSKEKILEKFQENFGNPSSFHMKYVEKSHRSLIPYDGKEVNIDNLESRRINEVEYYAQEGKGMMHTIQTGVENIFEEKSPTNEMTSTETITLCVGDKVKIWSTSNPSTITVTDFDCSSFKVGAMVLGMVTEVMSLDLKIKGLTEYEGNTVLEATFDKKGLFISGDEHKGFVFIDPQSYFPVLFDVVTHHKPVNYGDPREGEDTDVRQEIVRDVVSFPIFEINKEIPPDIFMFPEEIRNLPLCEYTSKEESLAIQEYREEVDRLNSLSGGVSVGFREGELDPNLFSEEDFNNIENLRISIPSNKCRGEKARSYQDYIKGEGWWW